MYKLLQIVEGNVVGEHRLTGDVFHIGRKPGNNLQPDDVSVSGNHAAITLNASRYSEDLKDVSVEDLGSTNGTRVNGRRVSRQRLMHGDLLTLGTLVLKFIDERALALESTRILLQDELLTR
jgi:pSer/pThr/pTyr-binding forkhead associated (FHA) protein